jgi:hypothetical protein
MVALRQTSGGVLIALRAQPKASRDAVVGVLGDRLKVAVTAPPTGGKANQAIEKLLARELGLRRSAVNVVAGQTSRDKTLELAGLTPKEAAQRLKACLGGETKTA